MTHQKLKFGIVGCGRISNNHLAALTSGRLDAELVAVCDVREDRVREKAAKHQVPSYVDYHAMLEQHPEIDVVSVLTPTGYHARHVIDMARHGRHFVVEKPMALSVADCDAMARACRKNDCRLFVVKQNRFNRAVVAARRALEAGRFGKLVMGTVRVRWKREQAYYDMDGWRGTWELDGGVIAQQATHHVDLLQWFMGPIQTIDCQIATRLMDIEVEDTAAAVMKFESGALGVFEATTATRPNDLEASLSILGEHGTVILGGSAVNKIDYWRFDEPLPDDEHIQDVNAENVPNVYGHGHIAYLAHVIQAILEGSPGPVEADEGRKNVQLLTAMYESAARGGAPVKPGVRIIKARIGRHQPTTRI
jgi:predicted dehydrogenase